MFDVGQDSRDSVVWNFSINNLKNALEVQEEDQYHYRHNLQGVKSVCIGP